MDKSDFIKYVQELKSIIMRDKRNFKQSIDIIITFKPSTVDGILYLPHPTKQNKLLAFIDDDFKLGNIFDLSIKKSDFDKYNKKSIKSLAKSYDILFGESTIMPNLASKFGKLLTSLGKMPSPKYGTVFTPTTNISEIASKMKVAIIINNKKNNFVSVKIGKEDDNDENLAENMFAVYSFVAGLINSTNIKRLYIKGTMTKPIKII